MFFSWLVTRLGDIPWPAHSLELWEILNAMWNSVLRWEEDIYLKDLGSCDRASWAKYEERKTNKMQQLDVYY